MTLRVAAPLVFVGCLSCGGRTGTEPSDGGDASGSFDGSAAADTPTDRKDVPEATPDSPSIDLPPCGNDTDCDFGQTCQQGYCCAGTFDGAHCTCGDGPGCKLPLTCCMPNWYQDGGCHSRCYPM